MMDRPILTLYLPGGFHAGQGGILRVQYRDVVFMMNLPPRIVELIVLMSEARDSSAHLLGETNCGFLSRKCIVAKLGRKLEIGTLSRYVSDFKREFLTTAKDNGVRGPVKALITTEAYLGMRLTWPVEILDSANLVRAGGPPRPDTSTPRDSDDDGECFRTAP